MYKFIDTNENSAGVLLPAEAMQINGEYIENLIDGYRTLSVEGREALSPELSTYETGIRDGAGLLSKRYPARTIIIKYQLICKTSEEFREAYNKLGGILNVENAELIFNDEQDKFFTGTPSAIGSVEPGRNAVIGEFEILCTDPFKYSVVEYEATPNLDDNSVLLDYNGTYKAFPILEADFYNESDVAEDGETETALTGNGDCGYIAFFNESKKIIQLGDPEEVDGEEAGYAKAQTLFNQLFKTSNAWGSAAQKLWAVNSGITSSEVVEQKGTVGVAIADYNAATTPKTTSGSLIKVWSDTGAPLFYYNVTAKAANRTENAVKVDVSITASLKNTGSYFGRGYGLKASVYMGGAWHSKTLKTTSEYWKGKTGHTVSMSFTVSELTDTATSLTGIKFKVERTDSTGGTAGELSEKKCNNLAISSYLDSLAETYYLKCTNYSTGANWHGASITRNIPADASGTVGAANFVLSYAQKMSIGNGNAATNEIGAFQVLAVTGSGDSRRIVAGVNVYKGGAGNKANLRFYVNNTVVKTVQISLAYNNEYFNIAKTSSITKEGGKITFNIAGNKYVFNDAEIEETAVKQVTFTFTQFGTKQPLTYNGLYWAKFVKNNCRTFKDMPNKFSASDILEADCKSGKIYLNGVENASLGALGNDWEGFYLTPGLNQIGFSYSDFVASAYAPLIKVRYREVFL